jgi:hypothetical protein
MVDHMLLLTFKAFVPYFLMVSIVVALTNLVQESKLLHF